MELDYTIIIAYIFGIIILFLLGRLLFVPIKIVLRLVFNALIGGVAILLVNFLGSAFNFHMDLNVYSALIVGMLGVPGIALLIILKYMFMS